MTDNKPTHYAYQVKEGKEKSYWTKIGIAFTNADNEGFTVFLDALPVDGKLVIRKPKPKEETAEE